VSLTIKKFKNRKVDIDGSTYLILWLVQETSYKFTRQWWVDVTNTCTEKSILLDEKVLVGLCIANLYQV